MSTTIVPQTTSTDDTPQARELVRAVTEARLACPDCTPPARQLHPDDAPPEPCHYCGVPTYVRTNGRGICPDCFVTVPRLLSDFVERVNAGRI